MVLEARRGRRRRVYIDIRYLTDTADQQANLIRLVYGDSEVWCSFQASRRRQRSLAGGLLSLAGRGSLQCLSLLLIRPLRPDISSPPAHWRGESHRQSTRSIMMRLMIRRHLLAVLLASSAAAFSPVRADSLRLEHRPMLLRTVQSTPIPMEIHGLRGQLDFDLPVPADASVRDAVVRLVFDSSPGLVTEKSWLQVLLNGSPVKTLPLGAGAGSVRIEVPLSGDLLHPGRNRLSALVSHEPAAGCGDRAAARVWTVIDPVNSYALLNRWRPDRPPNSGGSEPSGQLPADPRSSRADPDHGTALREASPASGGSLVGQGFALRVGDLPVAFRPVLAERSARPDTGAFSQLARTWPLAAYQVLMGTAEELAPFLGRNLPPPSPAPIWPCCRSTATRIM